MEFGKKDETLEGSKKERSNLPERDAKPRVLSTKYGSQKDELWFSCKRKTPIYKDLSRGPTCPLAIMTQRESCPHIQDKIS